MPTNIEGMKKWHEKATEELKKAVNILYDNNTKDNQFNAVYNVMLKLRNKRTFIENHMAGMENGTA